MEAKNYTLKVNIEPRAGGVDAPHLSITYGDREAEATILLPGQVLPHTSDFVRDEIAHLGTALKAMAKTHRS